MDRNFVFGIIIILLLIMICRCSGINEGYNGRSSRMMGSDKTWKTMWEVPDWRKNEEESQRNANEKFTDRLKYIPKYFEPEYGGKTMWEIPTPADIAGRDRVSNPYEKKSSVRLQEKQDNTDKTKEGYSGYPHNIPYDWEQYPYDVLLANNPIKTPEKIMRDKSYFPYNRWHLDHSKPGGYSNHNKGLFMPNY